MGLVFNTLGNHAQFTFAQFYCTIPELNTHFAFNYNKHFVRIFVVVPDKLALDFYKLELVVIHFRDYSRRPMFGEL